MLKRIFCLIIIFILILGSSLSAFAYEPTGFDIDAKNVILASLDTDEILYSKGADKKVYPASITKIMTSLLMLESEKFNPDGKIAMTKEALDLVLGTGSSVSLLKEGEEITQLDLLYLVLMASFGDCAYLAAQFYGGSIDNFVDMMNKRAKELGLKGTHYSNPVGLHDKDTYTTPRDTLTLTKAALKNKTFKKACEATRHSIEATNLSPARTYSTTIFLQDSTTNYYYSYAKGVKTGFTDEAGRCLVSTASYNGYNYICILFGCTDSKSARYEFIDSKNLYRWAFNNFSFKEIADAENPLCEAKVTLSLESDFVPLYIEKSFVSVLPKDADTSTIIIEPHLNKEEFKAPIKRGDVLGTADVIYAENVIGTVNLIAGDSVKKSAILTVLDALKSFFTSKYMILFYVILGIAIMLFILAVIKMNSKTKKRRVKYIPYKEREEQKNDKRDY